MYYRHVLLTYYLLMTIILLYGLLRGEYIQYLLKNCHRWRILQFFTLDTERSINSGPVYMRCGTGRFPGSRHVHVSLVLYHIYCLYGGGRFFVPSPLAGSPVSATGSWLMSGTSFAIYKYFIPPCPGQYCADIALFTNSHA